MDKVRRSLLIGGASSLAAPILPAFAAPLKYNLKAQRIANNSYVVIGKTEDYSPDNGGDIVNVAFIDTSDGVVLIDTGSSRRYGEALKQLIYATTGKDVIRVYNTHFHPDHCLGNQLFDKKKIAALPKTISGLKTSGEDFSSNLYRILGDWMRGTEVIIPEHVINYSSEKFGKHRFEMLPFSGHTDADLAILDHETGVLYAGDICFLDRAATTPHADLESWHKSLKEIKKIPHKIIFPGHGPADTTARSIEQTDTYLTWLETNLTKSARSGKDMLEAAKMPIPEKFQSIDVIELEIERSVAHLYPDIEEKTLPFLGQGDG
ncbi:quinoprotein relay system zinc metallohydrolase 2 [Hyphomicrobiales bacterium 4NK60-0047b]|jgi:uncharacterized sulfatase